MAIQRFLDCRSAFLLSRSAFFLAVSSSLTALTAARSAFVSSLLASFFAFSSASVASFSAMRSSFAAFLLAFRRSLSALLTLTKQISTLIIQALLTSNRRGLLPSSLPLRACQAPVGQHPLSSGSLPGPTPRGDNSIIVICSVPTIPVFHTFHTLLVCALLSLGFPSGGSLVFLRVVHVEQQVRQGMQQLDF
jgi:hypothetical protein